MNITTREKRILDRFNSELVKRDLARTRPSDEKLRTMSDAEILAGDWLVDIEDTAFWQRWDEANDRLPAENGVRFYTPAKVDALVKAGQASYWPKGTQPPKRRRPWVEARDGLIKANS